MGYPGRDVTLGEAALWGWSKAWQRLQTEAVSDRTRSIWGNKSYLEVLPMQWSSLSFTVKPWCHCLSSYTFEKQQLPLCLEAASQRMAGTPVSTAHPRVPSSSPALLLAFMAYWEGCSEPCRTKGPTWVPHTFLHTPLWPAALLPLSQLPWPRWFFLFLAAGLRTQGTQSGQASNRTLSMSHADESVIFSIFLWMY